MPEPSPLPPFLAYLRAIPPRKLVLALILLGSIVFVVFLLAAGAVALLVEGSMRGHGGLMGMPGVIKHAIIRHIAHVLHPGRH